MHQVIPQALMFLKILFSQKRSEMPKSKKKKNQDFQKVKLKVGRRLQKADNVTNASFKSRSVQVVQHIKTGDGSEPTTRRNLNIMVCSLSHRINCANMIGVLVYLVGVLVYLVYKRAWTICYITYIVLSAALAIRKWANLELVEFDLLIVMKHVTKLVF